MTTTITKSVFFNASRETVWSYLTDKDKLGEWYHPAVANLTAGSPYKLYEKGSDPEGPAMIWGDVKDMQSPSKLVTTFCIPPFGDVETIVTWTLEEAAGGTRLTVTHEGVAEAMGDAAMGLLQALDKGWDEHFQQLRDSIA